MKCTRFFCFVFVRAPECLSFFVAAIWVVDRCFDSRGKGKSIGGYCLLVKKFVTVPNHVSGWFIRLLSRHQTPRATARLFLVCARICVKGSIHPLTISSNRHCEP